MKSAVRFLTVFGLAVVLMFFGTGPVLAGGGDLCPMAGLMITTAVDQEKAIEYLEDDRREFIQTGEDDDWGILVVSESSDDIALLLTAEYVFFGVADDRDDRVADERRIEKAFGDDMRSLKNAVKKEMKTLWKADVVGISGNDVQALSDAAGVGTLTNSGGDWELETTDCEGMTLNVDEID